MPLIFRKTAKGLAEINTREHRLAPRMRSTLILVDGRRDAADINALIAQQADEVLQALAEQGFIEAVGETVTPPAPAPAPASAPAPALAPAPASMPLGFADRPALPSLSAPPASAAPTLPAQTLEALRRLAARALTDSVGPAAETLAIRIERAKSVDELRPLFAQAVSLVQSMRGRSAAEAFSARLPPF